MKVIVASKNPVKIAATHQGFLQMFPDQEIDIEGISVSSGVSDQPFSDEETYQGASNRAQNAHQAYPDADFWVGIEGGVADVNGRMEGFAWMVIISPTQKGAAKTCTFILPPKIADLLRAGYELGDADDMVFGASNSKQKNGAVGLLTGNVMVRETLYSPAIVLALIPFRNGELY